jgi:hypothetical protein
MRKLLFLIVTLIFFLSCEKEKTSPVKYWYDNIGSRTDIPFLPDSAANYFSYAFKRKKGDKIGIRFKAEFMYARYQSYNVYDINTRSSIASIADVATQADAGNENPYLTLTQPTNRAYTVYLLPDIPEAQTYDNKLLFPDKVTDVAVLLRNYLAERDVYGGVALPQIEAFDLVSGESVPVPFPLEVDFASFTNIVTDLSRIIDLTQLFQSDNTIKSFRFAGLGLFPNLDNQYLLAPLRLYPDEVAIIKFRPPSYPATFSELPTAAVRYFSLGLGDSKTYNYRTLADFQFKVSSDGNIYVVIGRNEAGIIAKAAGLNYMEWVPALENQGLIVYRNLLTHPDYAYNMNLVPDVLKNLTQVFNTGYLHADTYLEDRAPTGLKMSKAAYLTNFGGFEVVY